MTSNENRSPCAIEYFTSKRAVDIKIERWREWYQYNIELNEQVQTHSAFDKERLLTACFPMPFLGGFPLFFSILGPSKAFYTSRANLSSSQYLKLCWRTFDEIIPIFSSSGGSFAPFVLTFEERKQIAMFFKLPDESMLESVAKSINDTVIKCLSQSMGAANAPFPSLMALSEPIYSHDETRRAYCQARSMVDLYFFEHGPIVLTEKKTQEMRRKVDYDTVQEKCQGIMDLLERGNSEFLKNLEDLFMVVLRESLSFTRAEEALAYLHHRASILCLIYNTQLPKNLFDIKSYLTIEECYKAMEDFFQAMFALVREQGGHSRCVVRALYYIQRHYSQNKLSITEVAEYAHVTVGYLSRVFNGEVGMTPIEYVKKCRMENARKLLLSQDYQLNQVALSVGFTDEKYFTRVFRNTYGLTPSQFRENA